MKNLNLQPVKTEKDIIIKLNNDEKIPECLIGKFYLRNGANPYIISEKSHIFDGDGMVHVIEFKEDEIHYHNRWIETYRYKCEKKYNKEMFVRLGNLTSIEIFTKLMKRLMTGDVINENNGEGTANTNIVYHAGKLLALNEMDKPYLLDIKNDKLITIKRYDFNGILKHNMNAHPKIDLETGEMISLGYDILKSVCYISFIDKNGKLIRENKIKISGPRVIHDIGITKNKVIILDLPLEFSLKNVIMSEFPIHVNYDGESRIGIHDRKTSETEWYKIQNKDIIFHIANSWEQNNGRYIIIYVFCYDINSFNIKEMEKQRPILKRIIIDRDLKITKIKEVSKFNGELPIVEDNEIGKKCEYIYYSRINENGFDGIIRHDIKTKQEDIINFGDGLYGGECAIYQDFIVNILYNINTKKSELVIYDKNTLKLMNRIDLKCRIPFGFHGKILDINNN